MSAALVLSALREPEDFTASTCERVTLPTLAALALTASVGVATYGAAMHAWGGAAAMAEGALDALMGAGLAWTASLPSLYVIGSLLGSKLKLEHVALSSLVTVSFGGLAMLASIPVLWFFELCVPYAGVRLLVNALVFGGVGLSMVDVFLRVMARLEGRRFFHLAWLGLLSVVGAEMFWLFGLFNLG
ncbi:MAG: hypothetical protein H6741_00910 [Alphaproteobacteria bacterium]|nr:hypothetical protein [Alphaproteobacteria bacterium]